MIHLITVQDKGNTCIQLFFMHTLNIYQICHGVIDISCHMSTSTHQDMRDSEREPLTTISHT